MSQQAIQLSETVTPRSAYDQLSRTKQAFVESFIATGRYDTAIEQVLGGKGNARTGLAWVREPLVQAAIFERLQVLSERADVTLERVLFEIGKIATSNIKRFLKTDANDNVVIDDKGNPSWDFTKPTNDDWGAVKSLKIKTTKEGIETTLELYSKIDGLDKLMRRYGAYAPERVLVDHSGTIKTVAMNVNVSVEDLANMYAQRLTGGTEE
jgi:hypothetical protein